ncbi:MAG: DUF366 family protein [Planctomycetes bacterium]|nr:DUF366 family protein [Planctomycetota bacterium]
MTTLQTLVALEPRLDYDGTQLRPHFVRGHFGLGGDAAVAFRGACHVEGEALVDLADREAGLHIHSRDMVHLMIELFGRPLDHMVLLQRLLASLVAERVRRDLAPDVAKDVRRTGDDVFVGDGKLTVSIATVSPVSGLIHLGVNVDDRDTPVSTAALGPLGIGVDGFARGLLDDLAAEMRGIGDALSKVQPR